MKKITVLVLLFICILAGSIQVNASSTGITGPDVIHKQSNSILTITDILSLYSSDVGAIEILEDNYTGYGNILGVHTITINVNDGSISDTKTIDIMVVTELGNVTCVSDYKDIHLKTDQVLTPAQIVYVLENTGYIEITASTQMMVLSNTYTDNSDTAGQYLFEFRLVNSAGIDAVYSSIINVSDDENLFIPDITFIPEPTAISQVWDILQFFLYAGILCIVCYLGFKTYNKIKPRKKV